MGIVWGYGHSVRLVAWAIDVRVRGVVLVGQIVRVVMHIHIQRMGLVLIYQ